jgi:hypothetical protein
MAEQREVAGPGDGEYEAPTVEDLESVDGPSVTAAGISIN